MKNIGKLICSSAWQYYFGNKGEYRDLQKQTALVFPEVLPKAVCDIIINRINSLADDYNHLRVWRDECTSDTRVLGFEQDIGDLIHHFYIRRKLEAINAYTGRKVRSWFLMANRVQQKPKNLGSGGGLHRDSPFANQVKCIWYLNNVTSKNGPFQYVPNSHTNLYKSRYKYPLGTYRFNTVDDEMQEVLALAGSLLVCDTKCIHGGKPIQDGVRYALTLYTFTRVDAAANAFRKLGLNPNLSSVPASLRVASCT